MSSPEYQHTPFCAAMMTSNGSNANRGRTKPRPKHITTACLNCRKKKMKCDGVTPRCSHCVLYSQECLFQATPDKRKFPCKDRLAALEVHAQRLESLLRANGIAVPVFRPEASPLPDRSEPPRSIDDTSITGPNTSLDESAQNMGDVTGTNTTDPTEFSGKTDPFEDQLCERMGSLQMAEDGQLRFYGATSNLNILHNGPLSIRLSRSRRVNGTWQEILNTAGVGQFVSPELEDHLLKLYFCWEDPSIHIVDEKLYYRERVKWRQGDCSSAMYSEVLTNAMCSVGASLTSRRYPHLPVPLTEFFATRAKVLLELELEAPNISTVQSLVVLSAVDALLTNDARGWLDSGMAVRLAVDLGLHLDVHDYTEAGIIGPEEEELRSTVFWGAFVHDRMWSLYVGRPVALEYKHITLQLPSGTANEIVDKYWESYVDQPDGFLSIRLLDPIQDMTKYNILLCAKMESIREVLYPNRKTQVNDLDPIHTFVEKMSTELRDWHHNLPNTLVVDEFSSSSRYLPHVLQLHMQYHCIVILVNRPFFTAAKSLPTMSTSDVATCRDTCRQSAQSIARLLRIFDRLYTLRRINVQAVHLIFTASLIHVYDACNFPSSGASDAATADLDICCYALREMGQQFKNAIRALEVIIFLKGELLKQWRANNKRPMSLTDHQAQDSISPKRRCPSNDTDDGAQSIIRQTWGQFPITDLGLVNIDDQGECGTILEDDFHLDSLFWADFTAIEMPHNTSWT